MRVGVRSVRIFLYGNNFNSWSVHCFLLRKKKKCTLFPTFCFIPWKVEHFQKYNSVIVLTTKWTSCMVRVLYVYICLLFRNVFQFCCLVGFLIYLSSRRFRVCINWHVTRSSDFSSHSNRETINRVRVGLLRQDRTVLPFSIIFLLSFTRCNDKNLFFKYRIHFFLFDKNLPANIETHHLFLTSTIVSPSKFTLPYSSDL